MGIGESNPDIVPRGGAILAGCADGFNLFLVPSSCVATGECDYECWFE